MWSMNKLLNMLIFEKEFAIESEMEMISQEEIGKEKTNKPFSPTLPTVFGTVLVPVYRVEQCSSCRYCVWGDDSLVLTHPKCTNGKHHGSPGLSHRIHVKHFPQNDRTQTRGFASARRRERRLTYMALSPSSSYRLLAVPPPGLPVGSAIWMRAVLAHSAWRLDG